MKKLWFVILAALTSAQGIIAQDGVEYGLANHLGVGVSVGSDGIGVEVATPLTDYFALRAGVSFFPKISYEDNFKLNDRNPDIANNVDVKGNLNFFDVKLLADIYPFKSSGFHLTAGILFGKENLVSAENTSMFITDPAKYGKLGLKLGDYRVTTDKNGYAHADVTVNSVKPYLGIGIGRAIPKKRISVSCDLGVQLWGTPRLGAMTKDEWDQETYHKFEYTELDEYDDEDLRDGLEIASKFKVWPVINIRINGRIF